MSLEKIKAALIERQKLATDYQLLHGMVEKAIHAKITEAGIMDEIQSMHAQREEARKEAQSKVDVLSGTVRGLMEAANITDAEVEAYLKESAEAG